MKGDCKIRLAKPECPECQELARGTVEMLTGIAELQFEHEGRAEYGGSMPQEKRHWCFRALVLPLVRTGAIYKI